MIKRVVIAFAAGFISTVVFHQCVLALLHTLSIAPKAAWPMQAVPPFGIPAGIALAFWGGVWGVISPLGNDPDTLFSALMEGRSGVCEVVTEGPKGTHSNAGGAVDFDPAPFVQRPDQFDRVTQFSIAAASMAVKDARIEFIDANRSRAGVSFGTGMGAANALEETFAQLLLRDPDRVKPLTVLKVMNNAPAGHIAIQHGLGGPDLTYSCACSSSSVSIGEAFRQIRHGYADVMIAGGAEAPLTDTFF